MEIARSWKDFCKKLGKLEMTHVLINTEHTEEGVRLRIYAVSGEEKLLLFQPADLDLRKWKSRVEKLGVECKYGELGSFR